MFIQFILAADPATPPILLLQNTPVRQAGCRVVPVSTIPDFSRAQTGDVLYVATPSNDQLREGDPPAFFFSAEAVAHHLHLACRAEEGRFKITHPRTMQTHWVLSAEQDAPERLCEAFKANMAISLVNEDGEPIGFGCTLSIVAAEDIASQKGDVTQFTF